MPEEPARYAIHAELGRGGVAVVFEAYDRIMGRRIALKRIVPREDARDKQRVLELFEREFHTLAQLAHPRVVEVYDYSVDEQGPFYTMELLDGGDLQQLIPVDWRRACTVARDTCSALSLLHSRRMVHRDVSARNIRCTSDGLAKLIDFGAMVPMGPSKQTVVGTPPYAPPEVVQAMPLDARTDLYSLGATLYLALVGRHAYPARNFEDLQQRWQCAPAAPSQFVPEIPAALDELVLDLLQLDPTARPANAAEVIDRLSAIDGSAAGEHLLVAQAYLSTPVLVGRSADFELACKKITRLQRGRGSALVLEGASGVGRSRLLDACALEAKLRGAVVLRADADDAQGGAYGAVRALARKLLDALGAEAVEHAAPNLALLAQVIPELVQHAQAAAQQPGEVVARRGELQRALRGWFNALSRKKPLFIGIDDLQRIDEPSLAWLALMSQELSRHPIAVMATLETGGPTTPPLAVGLFCDASTRVKLDALSSEDTGKLLASVFGDVPNLGLVADRIRDVSAGNPRDTLRLAQHLLDRGVVRYAAGTWTLPAQLESLDLPASMTQALASRVDVLSAGARELASAVSLSPGLAVTFEECLALSAEGPRAHSVDGLNELIQAEILRKAGDLYELSQRAWAAILLARLDATQRRELHLRLACIFERRGNEPFRMAQHLIRASDPTSTAQVATTQEQALQELMRSAPDDLFTFIQSLPADWFETYEEAIRLCEKLNRPRKDRYLLRSRLSALVSVGGTTDRVHVPALIAQLCEESGLADYAKLEGMDAGPRLMAALGKASERYAATPEEDRVLPPPKAIRHLSRVLIQTSAVLTSALDVAGALSLPSLSPLVPLSPALAVIELMTQGMIARMTGHVEQAQVLYTQVLDRTSQADRAGLDPSHNTNMRCGLMGGLGMIEAGMGLKSSLDWADRIEAEPLYQVNAAHIRMLHHLWQGDIRAAAHCNHQVDLLRIQRSAHQFFEGTHLLWQIAAYAIAADLTRTKQTLEEIQVVCDRYPGWLPVRDYGLGEYHRIRGDLESAHTVFAAALDVAQAGEHQIWAYLAGARLRTLHELGRDAEALELGEKYVAAAERAEIGYLRNYVWMPMSLVQARSGNVEAAIATSERVIENFQALGATGLNLGLAHETRARVAILVRDLDSFDRHAALFRDTFKATYNPTLAARFQKLVRESQSAGAGLSTRDVSRNEPFSSTALSMFETCQSAPERAQWALACLAEVSGVTEGYLFLMTAQGPSCVAQIGDRALPPTIRALAEEYLTAQTSAAEVKTATMLGAATSHFGGGWRAESDADLYRPVLLSHPVREGMAVTGVAVLALPRDAPFVFPSRLATELSRRVAQSGDVSTMIVGA